MKIRALILMLFVCASVMGQTTVMNSSSGQTTIIGGVAPAPTPESGWQPPSDWIDISNPANNTINLLIGDFGYATMAFVVTTTGAAQYTVNWGDGNTENVNSGTTAQHTYAKGTGQACSLGYTTFKAVVSSGANILTFKVKNASSAITNQTSYLPILSANFGTTALTDMSNAFFASGAYCYSLASVIFPSSLSALTSAAGMFQFCYALASVTLPSSLNSLTNASYMFYYCTSLASITLPTSLNALTNATGMFYSCYSLASVTNASGLGSTSIAVDGTDAFRETEAVTSLSLNAKFSKIGVYGASGKLNKITSLRLTNATSTFLGTSPQVDISYTSLNATAINQVFTDLPTVSGGQVVKITGASGAAGANQTIATGKGWTVVN